MRSCFRYIVIEYPRHSAVYCTVARAKLTVALVYIVTFIICIPNFISITVQSQLYNDTIAEETTSCGGWNASTPVRSNSTSAVPLIWVVTFKLHSHVDLEIETGGLTISEFCSHVTR